LLKVLRHNDLDWIIIGLLGKRFRFNIGFVFIDTAQLEEILQACLIKLNLTMRNKSLIDISTIPQILHSK
jgi:hypothetical protein